MVVRISDKNQNYNNVTKLLVKPNYFLWELPVYCYIIDANHSLSVDRMINPADSAETLLIGNNVWSGVCCVCGKGSSLGDASVLGANSFLNSHVGARKLAIGSLAKVIKKL